MPSSRSHTPQKVSNVTITFCGAAGTVTGSCFLITYPQGRVLVDCGLFQGPKLLRELNYRPFPFAPRDITAVLLTHAHIDHSGLIPKLCAKGFKGNIFATEETNALLEWLLPDSGAIQEGEVERLNKRNARRGRETVQPIYTRDEAEACLSQLTGVSRNEWIDVAPGLRAYYSDAGHILGSCSIAIEIELPGAEKPLRLLFSGDIGPDAKALQHGPQADRGFDYVFVEATYGDRERPTVSDSARQQALKREVLAALKAGGNLIIPAFAVERTQELLGDLISLMNAGTVPRVPVFLDSPLAVRATTVFERFQRGLRKSSGGFALFRSPNIRFIEEATDSIALARLTGGAIIIAASGMCDAGRIRYHLKNNLWRANATVLLVGYQASGTMGALLESGVKSVRIHGEEIAVAARIRKLDVYSGHASRKELLAWLKAREPVSRGVFVIHGEQEAVDVLSRKIAGLGLKRRVIVPQIDQTYRLHPGSGRLTAKADYQTRITPETERALQQGQDWHNDFARLSLQFQHRLREAGDDKSRRKLLHLVERDLNAAKVRQRRNR